MSTRGHPFLSLSLGGPPPASAETKRSEQEDASACLPSAGRSSFHRNLCRVTTNPADAATTSSSILTIVIIAFVTIVLRPSAVPRRSDPLPAVFGSPPPDADRLHSVIPFHVLVTAKKHTRNSTQSNSTRGFSAAFPRSEKCRSSPSTTASCAILAPVSSPRMPPSPTSRP